MFQSKRSHRAFLNFITILLNSTTVVFVKTKGGVNKTKWKSSGQPQARTWQVTKHEHKLFSCIGSGSCQPNQWVYFKSSHFHIAMLMH